MRPFLNIIFLSTLLITGACSIGQAKQVGNVLLQHPYWQDNYYKYNTNKPDLPAEKVFRLGSKTNDTILPIESLKNVEVINANSSSLLNIKDNIKNLHSLKSLNLTWTNLQYFPRVVFNMQQLICIDLAFRNNSVVVDTLAYNFKKLVKLELLGLISCKLKDIPEPITELRKLKYLSVAQNNIKSILTKICKLDSLIELDLSLNIIESLPNELSKLLFLEKLNLYHNRLNSIPLSICKLPSLQNLDLRYNDITILPEEILNLKCIRNLDLSGNPRLHISKELAEQMNKSLSFLKTINLVGTNHTEKEKADLIKIFNNKIIFFLID